MLKIKTKNKISDMGLKNFDSGKYIVNDSEADPDAILVRSALIDESELKGSLKAIARAGAGVNNIPVDDCTKKGIVVFNTPGANANAVKELTLAALLMSSRSIVEGVEWVKTLPLDDEIAKKVEKGKSNFAGPELSGKSLGVFGLGAIGAMVANTALDLGMEVYGYDPYITVDSAWALSRGVKKASDKSTIFNNCDYIAIHIPSTPDTKGVIDKNAIAEMKDGVRIINLSRGDIVNNNDIKEALESGKIKKYVTDFPTKEILNMKNTVAIPHLGASTPESEENCACMAVNELMDYLENGNITNSVNFPNLINPKGGDQSVCVIHKNVPNMLAQISSALSGEGLNIENLSSRSKKDHGYSVFEIKGRCSDNLSDKLYSIEGIIKVNIIENK